MKRFTLPHLLLVLLMAAIWGGNSTAMRIIVDAGMGPVTAAALRFSISIVIVYVFAALQGVPAVPSRQEVKLALPFIAFTIIQIGLFNTAARYTTAGRVGVLVNLSPLWVVLVSGFIFTYDRLTTTRLAGAAVAVGGVFAVFAESLTGSGGGTLGGDMLAFGSSLFLASLILYQKWLLERGMHPMRILTLQMTGNVPAFYVIGALTEGAAGYVWSGPVVWGLLFQGIVVGGGAFIIFQYMHRIYAASQIASFFFLIPVFSVIAGALVLGEAVTWGLGIGLVLVAAGIYVINRR